MHSCNYCSKTYTWLDSLKRHIKNKHNNEAASESKDSTVKVSGSVTTAPSTTQQETIPPVRESKLIKIGNRKFVSIRRHGGEPRVNIRQYIHDSYGKPYSTKRGILLTATEWQQLKQNVKDIDTSLNKRNK